jgi:hypothetical protein
MKGTMIRKTILPLMLIVLCGCQLFSPEAAAPPTTAEKHFFDVSNSVVERVVVKTNYVTVTNLNIDFKWVTNEFNVPKPVLVTNFVEVPIPTPVWETQKVTIQQLVPGAKIEAVKGIGTLIGDLFGVGGLVAASITGAYSIYLKVRNRALSGEADHMTLATGGLVETTETILNVLKQTPQGQQLMPAVISYLEKHQEKLGTIQEIRDLLAVISKSRSLDDANEILDKVRKVTQ